MNKYAGYSTSQSNLFHFNDKKTGRWRNSDKPRQQILINS